MFSTILSAAVLGIEALPVRVEIDLSDGLPAFVMVGDLAPEVKEASDRVRTALKNAGIRMPAKKVTVNLSPAKFRKEGTRFDLAIAAALLTAVGIVPEEYAREIMVVGELGLNGNVLPVGGVLQTVLLAKECGCRMCLTPKENVPEGESVQALPVVGIATLQELLECLLNPEEAALRAESGLGSAKGAEEESEYQEDFREVNGQETVRRAAEIAAAGMHNFLMIGSPGAGKTMIARRMPSILPPLTREESIEVTEVYSACGLLADGSGLMRLRPFRSPHHTVSPAALTGGGRRIHPGEMSLATRGVLFLDELPEFSRSALESLRQPMEDGEITVSRTGGSFTFPAHFQLVAAMNPCKCGYYPDRSRCHCLPSEISHYLHRVSRPLLDRMDICTEAPRVEYRDITDEGENESSAAIRARVHEVHKIQKMRYEGCRWQFNSQLSAAAVRHFCPLGTEERQIMETAFDRMNLSARAYHRIIKVARTIADLAGERDIRAPHLLEAIAYRSVDRKFWEAE